MPEVWGDQDKVKQIQRERSRLVQAIDASRELESLLEEAQTYLELAQEGEQVETELAGAVDNLEKRGLVVRQRQVEDRRHVVVHLTEEGRVLIAQLLPQHAAAITRGMAILTRSEQLELGRLCKKLGTQDRR